MRETKFFAFLVLALISLWPLPVMPADISVAVLYPSMREPYRTIFNDIVNGIRSKIDGPVSAFELEQGANPARIEAALQENRPDILIALGSGGKEFTQSLALNTKIVAGGAFFSSQDANERLSGISLTPSPDALFARLKELMPNVREVIVVYHEATNGWLIELAREHAREAGLELRAIVAQDVREAAIRYREILELPGNGAHALWLLQGDPTLDERGLLPTILSKAWEQNLIVFSSNPSHVKRGALFSLFPDNFAMGESLAEMAIRVSAGGDQRVEPLRDLRIALNIRTAEHLGLRISRTQERNFDLIFPNR